LTRLKAGTAALRLGDPGRLMLEMPLPLSICEQRCHIRRCQSTLGGFAICAAWILEIRIRLPALNLDLDRFPALPHRQWAGRI
jgi:hypothetical protein